MFEETASNLEAVSSNVSLAHTSIFLSRMAQPAQPVIDVVPRPLPPQDPNIPLPPVPAAPPNSNDILQSVKYHRNVVLSSGVF